jgi:hypothetical protein
VTKDLARRGGPYAYDKGSGIQVNIAISVPQVKKMIITTITAMAVILVAARRSMVYRKGDATQ